MGRICGHWITCWTCTGSTLRTRWTRSSRTSVTRCSAASWDIATPSRTTRPTTAIAMPGSADSTVATGHSARIRTSARTVARASTSGTTPSPVSARPASGATNARSASTTKSQDATWTTVRTASGSASTPRTGAGTLPASVIKAYRLPHVAGQSTW
uniref:(northern house mosquito) hypothetical protein n=1 Tax=Culex pipiens TaxID=7175 RepID=A0A8D8L5N9_CULPI